MGEWPKGMVLVCLTTWCGFDSRLPHLECIAQRLEQQPVKLEVLSSNLSAFVKCDLCIYKGDLKNGEHKSIL